jgi:hypothetical protein
MPVGRRHAQALSRFIQNGTRDLRLNLQNASCVPGEIPQNASCVPGEIPQDASCADWRITGGSLEDHWDHPGIIQAPPWGFPGLSLEASSCHADSILERQWDITGTASKRSGMSLRRRSSSACDGALSWDGGPFYGGFLTAKKQTCNNLTWKCLCHNELEKLPQLGTFFRESITAPKKR